MKKDPIRYTAGPGAGYSNTIVLVRLRRDSLDLTAHRDYRAVPERFTAFVSRYPQMSICPTFLEGRFYLPEQPGTEFLRRLANGVAEYVAPGARLFRFNNCQQACISDGEVATLLTNFRLRFDDPVTAEKAFVELEKMAEVASVEWWPQRVIAVRVPRGEAGYENAPTAQAQRANLREDAAAASELAMLSLTEWARIPKEVTRIKQLLEDIEKCTCQKADSVPDDAYQKWAHTAIEAPKDANLGDGMTIAILDLGADHRHPELQGRIIPGIANATMFDTGDLEDGTFADRSLALNPNFPRGFHGTAVASLIAGRTVGVLPKAQILSFQVAADKPFISADRLVQYFPVDPVLYLSALNTLSLWAWPVTVANMSIGGQAPLANAESLALQAVASKGITLIASAGNSFRRGDFTGVMYPARDAMVLSIGAVGIESATSYYKLASFSNFDPDDFNVNVVAPGVGIYHAVPKFTKPGGFAWGNGTSYASPYASAIVAQTIELKGRYEPQKHAVRLQAQSKDADFDNRHGYGLAKWPKTE